MGLFNIFKKNKKSEAEDELNRIEADLLPDEGIVGEVEHGGPSEEKSGDKEVRKYSFVMGVLDTAVVEGTENLVVTGNIKGNVEPNMVISAINFGDDNKEVIMTTVSGIDVDDELREMATDCFAGLILEGAANSGIKPGTVLYTRDVGNDSIHDAYVASLSEVYVKERELELTDEEIDALSITDCSEIWRLNTWYMTHEGKEEEETVKKVRIERLNKIVSSLCKKIINADEIYYVHDKGTGEAHLYSQTFDKGNGTYMCSLPNIMIISKAYRRHYKRLYNNDKTELAVVRNGSDKMGIYNFLAGNFYINGACGVAVNAIQISIAAGMLVKKPEYKDIPIENIPVTNPDLVRWMLLIGQLDTLKKDNEEALVFRLYYRFMGIEMTKARLIIPMKHQSPQEGESEGSENDGFGIATMKGKDKKDAVIMYTDWRRLRSEYGKDWDGMVHRIAGLVGKFDCAINPTRFPKAGMYVTEEMYKNMAQMAKPDEK
ncbi:MAG: hypothetical protein K6E98_09235 [Lachnospiraceae bacterium]|nr:hypothetical protein [Lachnospiraceae bacterium]